MSLFAHLRRLRRRLVSTLTGHCGSRLWTSQLGDSGFNEKPRRWRRGPGQVGGRRPIRLAPWRKEPEIARQTSGRMKTKWQNSKGRYRQSRDVEDESASDALKLYGCLKTTGKACLDGGANLGLSLRPWRRAVTRRACQKGDNRRKSSSVRRSPGNASQNDGFCLTTARSGR
jgi:hypothetical protein